uniref:Uncharacterized protein n=1 Tax=Lactuca sativa TaxID=4236 RepID=A0A9R1UMV8_LACSA|nr:hypothetical protein LSAT_V11C800401650 [Lactuca sativa]
MASILKGGRLTLALIILIVISSSSHIITTTATARTPYNHERQLGSLQIAIMTPYNKMMDPTGVEVEVEVEVVDHQNQNQYHAVQCQVRAFVGRVAVERLKWEGPNVASSTGGCTTSNNVSESIV